MYSLVLGVSSLGGGCDGLTAPAIANVFDKLSQPDKLRFGIINAGGTRTSKDLKYVSSLVSLASHWKEPAARTPYMSSFIALLQRMQPLMSSKKYRRLFICASAPRAALTIMAGRWLASFCSQAEHHGVSVLWVDTSSAPASAATFKFGRSLSLIPLPLMSTSGATLPLETFFMSSESSTTRRFMNWHKTRVTTQCTFLWREDTFNALATTSDAEFAWTRLHNSMERRGWIVIPSRVCGLMSVIEKGDVVLARYGDRHLALVPVTPMLLLVYSMPPKVFQSLPTSPLPPFDSECDLDGDPLVLVPHKASVVSGAKTISLLRDDIAKCGAEVAPDSPMMLAVPRKTVPSPPKLVKKVKKPKKPPIDISKIPEGMDISSFRRTHVLAWYNKMVEGKLSCKIAGRELRTIERCLRTNQSPEERSAVKKEIAAILRKDALRITRDVLDVPENNKLQEWDWLRKAQCLCRWEILRLEESPDPILEAEYDSIHPLIASLGISRLHTDIGSYIRCFLDQVVYKQYGRLFPTSILDLYDYFEHDPPPILLPTPTPTPVVEPKPAPVVAVPRASPKKRPAKPVEPEPSGPPTLSAGTAALLHELKTASTRRHAFRADVVNSARPPPEIKWRRPKNLQVLLDSELRPKKKPQFPPSKPAALRKTAAWRRHDALRPRILVPESPIRPKRGRPLTFSPETNARFVALGLMVLESPLPDRKRNREEEEAVGSGDERPCNRTTTRTKLEFPSSSDED